MAEEDSILESVVKIFVEVDAAFVSSRIRRKQYET